MTSKTKTIINESDINDVFESFYSTFISNIQKSLGNGSGWNIDSALYHTINISNYNALVDSSYIKLPKERDHPKVWLILKYYG